MRHFEQAGLWFALQTLHFISCSEKSESWAWINSIKISQDFKIPEKLKGMYVLPTKTCYASNFAGIKNFSRW